MRGQTDGSIPSLLQEISCYVNKKSKTRILSDEYFLSAHHRCLNRWWFRLTGNKMKSSWMGHLIFYEFDHLTLQWVYIFSKCSLQCAVLPYTPLLIVYFMHCKKNKTGDCLLANTPTYLTQASSPTDTHLSPSPTSLHWVDKWAA